MKRRKFILGLGGFSVSGVALVGSGAFSSVEAERRVSVETARDARAFLRLDPGGGSYRSSRDDGLLAFRLPAFAEKDDAPDSPNNQNPQGLGTDSVYRFGQEADDDGSLFTAKNQGTNTVRIYGASPHAADEPSVRIFNTETFEVLTEERPSEDLEPGDGIGLGVEVDTSSLETEDFFDTIVTIHAETDDSLSS